jgi:hypothetical protein
MNITRTLLLTAAAGTMTLAGSRVDASDLTPAVANNLTGTLRIQQSIPCDDDVDQTTPVIGGRIELSPAEGIDAGGGKTFALGRVDVSFGAFSIHRSCLTASETRNYTELGVQLSRSVLFTAQPSAPGAFTMTIPKSDVTFYSAAIVNGQLQTVFERPFEDVTGSIDLNTGAVRMHVVVKNRVHFEGICVLGVCAIDTDRDGFLTAEIAGTLAFPDADGDGVPDRNDNCKFVANPDQTPVATPTITAPPSLTMTSCVGFRPGGAIAADVCDGGPVAVTNDAPSVFSTGANTVTWTARDSKNRTATATQTITIVDSTTPTFTFVPLDISANNCGPVDLGLATATDDCAGTPTITNDSPGYFYVGTTVVTWKATDASGNFSTATQKVTVVDTVPPTVSCTATNPVGTSFIVTGSDACGAPVLTLGSYVIASGEQIKIQETGQSGVQLINDVSSDNLRHFQVGKGQGVIVAKDGSGNVSTAVCR